MIWPITARSVRHTPSRFTASVRSTCSTGAVASVPVKAMPALAIATSIPPKRAAVAPLDACLAAVDERNPELNAITWRNDEEARAAAGEADRRLAAGGEAPFLGVPIPIKDLTPVAGWPVTFGSRGGPAGVSPE